MAVNCGMVLIEHTLDDTMLDSCTNMLYSAEPTVRVRTEPALRLVMATD